MSTKNLFHSGPEGPVQSPPLLLFLLLSLAVHIAAYVLVFNTGALGTLFDERTKTEKGPIEVEMVAAPEPAKEQQGRWIPVIDLPSSVKSDTTPKKEVIRYADRDVSVRKESVPKPGEEHQSAATQQEAKTEKSTASAQKKSETDATGKQKSTTHKTEDAVGITSIPKGAVVVPPYMRTNQDKGTHSSPSPAETKEETGGEAKKPSLFPSGERLSELAQNSPSNTRRGKTGHILQLNTTELIYQKYLLNVRDRVSFYWEYPVAAARNGWQGTLTVDFVVSRDGKITEIEIDRSSGYPVLDDAAITAIKLAGPFFTFPEHFILDKFNIKYQFEYRLTSLPPPVM